MKQIINTRPIKLLLVVLMAALVWTASGPVARAQTIEQMSIQELVQLVNQLQAQLQQSTGGVTASAVCPFTWTRDLSRGSRGADVLALQRFLNAQPGIQVALTGPGSPGNETSFYGPLTQAAVSQFQVMHRSQILTPIGLVNPTGYFGPMSRSMANSLCVTLVPPPTPPPDDDDDEDEDEEDELQGGAGSIEDADFISGLNNEEVGEGEDDVEVAGLEIEPDGSDIEITAVSLNFDQVDAQDDFDDYAIEISIWLDDEEVARVDATRFEDDDEFNATIPLDRGAIIREGETGDLIVAVSAINNLDSDQEGDDWNVGFESIRFRDAQNAVITDSSTGDIGDDDDNSTTDGDEREFEFVPFATAADIELRVSEGDDDINDARTIPVDENDETTNVEFFSFDAEAEGNSDLIIDDLTVDFTASGATVGDILTSVSLIVDGDVVASESVPSTAGTTTTVTFDNMEFTIEAGETVSFTVEVDVDEFGGNFGTGDSLEASTNPDNWEVEDEQGDDIEDTDKTGTASTEAHTFRAAGLVINPGVADSASVRDTTDAAGGEEGHFTIRFEVTAFEDDIFIPLGATTSTTSVDESNGVAYQIEDNNGNPVTTGTSNAAVSSTAGTEGSFFRVREGRTESFTLSITFDPASDGFYRAQLDGINYNIGLAAAADVHQDATPPTNYETDFVNLDA